jgi:UV DNA damage endonuclease
MNIGFVGDVLSRNIRTSRTFRLASYTPERFRETVAANLRGVREALLFAYQHGIGVYRFSSDIIPFASHPVCTIPWEEEFAAELREIGDIVRRNGIRTSAHPDQFVVLNALDTSVVQNGIGELMYHVRMFEAMGLGPDHTIQIHVGGVYGDKREAMRRFAQVFRHLDSSLRSRLAIENDDRSYSVADCLSLHSEIGVPVIFDVFHHSILNGGEPWVDAARACFATWRTGDAVPLMDYSTQKPGGRMGNHADHIDAGDFRSFVRELRAGIGDTCDVILEIKDKDISALEAVRILHEE